MVTSLKTRTFRPNPMAEVVTRAMEDYLVVIEIPKLGKNASLIADTWFATFLGLKGRDNSAEMATEAMRGSTRFNHDLIESVAALAAEAVNRVLNPSAADETFEKDVAFALAEQEIVEIMRITTASV